MRVAFIGSNSLTISTAELMLEANHQIVVIERDRTRIDALSERLDVGFIHGDGTSPEVLRDAEPKSTDILFCLLESDQTNILASLIGRSLGFERVVPRVNDPQFQRICTELGLDDSIMPNRAVAAHLKQLLGGETSLELSSLIRNDAGVFSFVVTDDDAGPLESLSLPNGSRIVCLYHKDHMRLPQDGGTLSAGDEVILIGHHKALERLRERWGGKNGR